VPRVPAKGFPGETPSTVRHASKLPPAPSKGLRYGTKRGITLFGRVDGPPALPCLDYVAYLTVFKGRATKRKRQTGTGGRGLPSLAIYPLRFL
jgi:hypothetical protein